MYFSRKVTHHDVLSGVSTNMSGVVGVSRALCFVLFQRDGWYSQYSRVRTKKKSTPAGFPAPEEGSHKCGERERDRVQCALEREVWTHTDVCTWMVYFSPSSQTLVSKHCSPSEGTRVSWRVGRLPNQGRKSSDWARITLLCQWGKKGSKNDRGHVKRSQGPGRGSH